jgi:NDP-sugar pyrophosphorylase family protein
VKAMILAAGLGTRLRPFTNDRPKALVQIGGRTLLEITLARLRSFGISEVIINAHHFADMIVDYLASHQNFGMRIEISREEVLLDTGGGLKKAAWFFREDSGTPYESFLLHNVDVLSTIDLGKMTQFHVEQGGLATLAVQDRETSRPLLVDDQDQLCGRLTRHDQKMELARPSASMKALAFSGIHVVNPRLLEMMPEEGVYSIIDTYLKLAASGEKILGFRADEYYWRDLGKPENVEQAARDLENGLIN